MLRTSACACGSRRPGAILAKKKRVPRAAIAATVGAEPTTDEGVVINVVDIVNVLEPLDPLGIHVGDAIVFRAEHQEIWSAFQGIAAELRQQISID
jgi:hypothetical protein